MTIETYPKMDAKIIEFLRWDTSNPLTLYAARRIEELETTNIHLERLDTASQQALTRALHENRVRGECLKVAMEALRWYDNDITNCREAFDAIAKIETRLAQLEPEEETG